MALLVMLHPDPELSDEMLMQLIACKPHLVRTSAARFRFYVKEVDPALESVSSIDKFEGVEYTIHTIMLVKAIERLMLERDAALEMLTDKRIK